MTTDDDYTMGLEFEALDDALKAAIRALVEKVKKTGFPEAQQSGDGDMYAYRHPGGGIAWGYSGMPRGVITARGVSKSRPKIV